MERPYFDYEKNIRKTNRLFSVSAALILTGTASLGIGFYKSIEDADHYENQKNEIGFDQSLSPEEKTEKISKLSTHSDENQAINATGLALLGAGVAFFGAAAVEASQKRK